MPAVRKHEPAAHVGIAIEEIDVSFSHRIPFYYCEQNERLPSFPIKPGRNEGKIITRLLCHKLIRPLQCQAFIPSGSVSRLSPPYIRACGRNVVRQRYCESYSQACKEPQTRRILAGLG